MIIVISILWEITYCFEFSSNTTTIREFSSYRINLRSMMNSRRASKTFPKKAAMSWFQITRESTMHWVSCIPIKSLAPSSWTSAKVTQFW